MSSHLTTEQGREMDDKRNCHGTVGKLSLEQQFHKSDEITFLVLNFWNNTPSATRSYGRLAGRLSDEIKIHYA